MRVRNHRRMRADMHLDPDGLRAAAALVGRVLDDLCPLPPGPDALEALRALPDGPALTTEYEWLLTAVERVKAELASMHTAMRVTAAAAEAADADLAQDLRAAAGR